MKSIQHKTSHGSRSVNVETPPATALPKGSIKTMKAALAAFFQKRGLQQRRSNKHLFAENRARKES